MRRAFYGLSFKYSLTRTWWIHRPLDRSVPWVTTTNLQTWAKSSSSRRWGHCMLNDLKMNLIGNRFIKYICNRMFCIISVHCFQAQCLSEFSYLWLIVKSYFCITSISCSGKTSQENSWVSILTIQFESRYVARDNDSITIQRWCDNRYIAGQSTHDAKYPQKEMIQSNVWQINNLIKMSTFCTNKLIIVRVSL